jgi:hypothetical protein
VALKSMVILQNLITTNHRESGESKDNLKLTEVVVVTMGIGYREQLVHDFSQYLRSCSEVK